MSHLRPLSVTHNREILTEKLSNDIQSFNGNLIIELIYYAFLRVTHIERSSGVYGLSHRKLILLDRAKTIYFWRRRKTSWDVVKLWKILRSQGLFKPRTKGSKSLIAHFCGLKNVSWKLFMFLWWRTTLDVHNVECTCYLWVTSS